MKKGTTKTAMTFREVLESEHKHLVEKIEWGSSDPELIEYFKKELFEKTGHEWVD